MGLRDTRKMFEDMTTESKALGDRISNLETSEYSIIRFFHADSKFLDGETVTSGVTFTSDSVFDFGGIPSENVRAVLGTFWTDLEAADFSVYMGSADDTPDANSQQYYWNTSVSYRDISSQFVMIPVNSDGKFKLECAGVADVVVYLVLFGYVL